MIVSALTDAEPRQVDAAAEAGFAVCEIHTGPYAHAFHEAAGDLTEPAVGEQLRRIAENGRRIHEAGMRFNAGHALNYQNVGPIAALPGLRQLHIGHAIVARSVFVGMRSAVQVMKQQIQHATGPSPNEP